MKKVTIGIIFLISFQFLSFSQKPITLNVKQPPKLVADAGEDAIVQTNSTITLGGSIVAQGGTGSYSYYWYPQKYLDVPNAERPVASNLVSSTQFVLTVYDNNCYAKDTVSLLINPELKIYPLPAQNTMNLDLPDFNNNEYTIQLFTTQGKIIFTKQYHSNKIILNLESYKIGFYILKISNGEINKTMIISKI